MGCSENILGKVHSCHGSLTSDRLVLFLPFLPFQKPLRGPITNLHFRALGTLLLKIFLLLSHEAIS